MDHGGHLQIVPEIDKWIVEKEDAVWVPVTLKLTTVYQIHCSPTALSLCIAFQGKLFKICF